MFFLTDLILLRWTSLAEVQALQNPDPRSGGGPSTSALARSALVRCTTSSASPAAGLCLTPRLVRNIQVLQGDVSSDEDGPLPGESVLKARWRRPMLLPKEDDQLPKVEEQSTGSTRRPVCAVAVCKAPYPSGVSLHRFPKDKDRQKAWMVACHRKDKFNPDTSRICSRHFKDDDFERNLQAELLDRQQKVKLKKTAVPSQLLLPRQEAAPTSDRATRHSRRERKCFVEATLEDVDSVDQNNNMEDIEEEDKEGEVAMLRRQLAEAEAVLVSTKQKLRNLQSQNCRLKRKLKGQGILGEEKMKKLVKAMLLKKTTWSKQQVDFFLSDKTKARWSSEDIVLGLTLRALSRRLYQLLRKKKLLPLPGLSTLRKQVQHFKCLPGVMDDVLKGNEYFITAVN